VKIIPVKYFEFKNLNLFILISYTVLKNHHTISLDSIQFFNKQSDVLKYIENNKLYLAKNNNPIENKSENLINLMMDYLSGKKINLYQKINDLNIEIPFEEKFPTSFAQKVMKYLTENVKYGEITTYSGIGQAIGSKAYRAIGNVMKSNPLPLIIPCHRVIRKDGDLGGFMGKMDKEWQTNLKLNLLKIEGSM